MAFPEHEDAYKHFNVDRTKDLNEGLSKLAAQQGFDSLQFISHVDHLNYPCDSKNTGKFGLTYMGLEIVGVKLAGTYACGTNKGTPAAIKAGWRASKACGCNNTQEFLNCKGVPILEH